MHQGMLNYFDQADNAFVSAYRAHHEDGSFEIRMQYLASPKLDNAILIIVDPMLASGASIDNTIKSLRQQGNPNTIHVAAAIASKDGLEKLVRRHPEIHFWLGAVDEELTAKSYIVPGLGDAGDLSFGQKEQD